MLPDAKLIRLNKAPISGKNIGSIRDAEQQPFVRVRRGNEGELFGIYRANYSNNRSGRWGGALPISFWKNAFSRQCAATKKRKNKEQANAHFKPLCTKAI